MQTCLPGAFCCWFGLRGSLWLPLSLPLASDQFFTLNSLLRTRIRSQAAMWVSYRPDQAWVALLLNIASSISCHKLAGVALARCLSRQVKNDPPTADRTAQLAGWAMGVCSVHAAAVVQELAVGGLSLTSFTSGQSAIAMPQPHPSAHYERARGTDVINVTDRSRVGTAF